MAKKKISFTLAAMIVFFAILLSLVSMRLTGVDKNFPNPVGNILRETLAPLQSGVTSAALGIRNVFSGFWNVGKNREDNAVLKAKVEELSKENNQLKQKVLAAMRYEELEKKFNAPEIWTQQYIGAVVIDRNPSNWYHTVVINRGSANGVKINQPVMTNLGLVGKVVSVTANTAEVIIILDPEGQVSATVRQSQGEPAFGVAVGDYKRNPRGGRGTFRMTVPKDDKINPGDLVLTSGMGGVYPKDIPIGRVEEVAMETGGLLKTATIAPLVQFDRLEEVFVVLTGGK